MAAIIKKEYSQFLEDSKNLIEMYDFGTEKTERGFKIKTFLGILNISFWESSILYSTFMRFESPFNLESFRVIFPKDNINRFTFKWNIHEEDKNYNLKILKDRLDTLSLF